ncbi:MAG: hypothetical protein L7F78_18500 [Syntrophales bacterium LBB04]|nr:hypothetical protein [Syntrophales bacterium LBB04]
MVLTYAGLLTAELRNAFGRPVMILSQVASRQCKKCVSAEGRVEEVKEVRE